MSDQALEISLKVLADTHGADVVAAALKKVTATSGQAGAAAGEQFGEFFNEKVSHKVEKHLVNKLGELVGVHGLAKLFMAGGAGGAAAAVGLQVLDTAIAKITEHVKEMMATSAAFKDLGGLVDGPSVMRLKEMAETMGDGKTKALEWAAAFQQLARAGAKGADLETMAGQLAGLNKVTGDLNVSTALQVELLAGNAQALQAYGIYVNDALPITAQLAELQERLAVRATTGATSLREFKDAMASAAQQTEAWAAGIRSVNEGLEEAVRQIKAVAEAKMTQSEKDEGAEQAENSANLAAGLIDEKTFERNKGEIANHYAEQRRKVKEEALQKEKGAQQSAFDSNSQNLLAIEQERTRKQKELDLKWQAEIMRHQADLLLRSMSSMSPEQVAAARQTHAGLLQQADQIESGLSSDARGKSWNALRAAFEKEFGGTGDAAKRSAEATAAMEKAAQVINELDVHIQELNENFKADQAKRDAEASAGFFNQQSKEQHQREQDFERWMKEQDRAIKEGRPGPRRPRSTEGHDYQPGDDGHYHETSSLLNSAAEGISRVTESAGELLAAVTRLEQRFKYDGTRVG